VRWVYRLKEGSKADETPLVSGQGGKL
jgi:hypothetical protein